MDISILIPVYNEENAIKKTITDITEVMKEFQYEVLIINDGSKDRTGEILKEFNANTIRILEHKQNKGYGASLKTGLRAANSDNIIITDADGTYPNEKIPDMYKKYKQNNLDMLIGSRTGKNVSYPFLKKIPKFFIIKLANYITNTKIVDINSGLRIFKKKIAMEFFHLFPNGFSFTTTITMGMLCSDYEVEYFPIDYYEREGKSKIHPWKDTIGFFKLLLKIALYFNPFKFFSPLIFLFSLGSLFFVIRDVFITHDLSQGSLFFPIITLLFFSIGLLADLIIKRSIT